ncbi:MAG: aldose 1-epimerase family protein [Hyphomicrobiales bacterium]|nr:MAG: aldose 1-epimerase family protein [Hyphomicrobiales bacterium]
MTDVTIASSALTAKIAARGAELVALDTAQGQPLLWHGDPAWWSGRAPLLFPIVGRLPGDKALIDGASYDLPQHGFARGSTFTLVSGDASFCCYELVSTPELMARYPRDFALRVAYEISGASLRVTATVINRDARPMPFSFGYHPAFRWPLASGAERSGHCLVFGDDETAPIHRPDDGLLSAWTEASPVIDRRIALSDALFDKGALIFTQPRSRRVTYQGPDGTRLTVAFDGMPHLGIWTKPGAPFVCIEPWQGYAAPVGFAGELATKPGIVILPPSASAGYSMTIAVST